MIAHCNFVMASAASVPAVGLPIASKLSDQTGSPQMSFTSSFRPSEAQIVISVSMQMEIIAQPVGGAEALCRGLLEVAIRRRIRRLLISSPGRKSEY